MESSLTISVESETSIKLETTDRRNNLSVQCEVSIKINTQARKTFNHARKREQERFATKRDSG